MFSAQASRPTRLIAGCSSSTARKVPSTLAAPHMSNFISSMPRPGFRLMPPVSKVMPLPTSTCGASSFLAPLYCRTISRGGCSLPWDTARKEPMPSSRSFFSSSTSTFRPLCSLARALACSPMKVGWQTFGGRLPRSRVSAMPLAMAWASLLPCSTAAASALSASRVIFFSLSASAFWLL
ncbi:hypothetical protein D9M71_691320 [compost metagenome]